jgi:hypothetical protein
VAVDLTALSDADLQAVASGDMSKVSDEGLTHLSSPASSASTQSNGIISRLSNGLSTEGQLALSAATHLVSGPLARGAAGLLARFTNQDPDKLKAIADKYAVYDTPVGSDARTYTDAMTRAVAPIMASGNDPEFGAPAVAQSADEFIGKYGGPAAQTAARQAVGTAGDIMAVAPLAGAIGEGVSALRASPAIAEGAQVARTPDEIAQASGVPIRPSDATAATGSNPPSVWAKLGEAVGGSKELRRDFILKAKPALNSLAAQEAGLPADTQLSSAALDQADLPHAAVYQQVRDALPDALPFDQQYRDQVANAGANVDSLRPLPASAVAARDAATELGGGEANGRQLLATISDYRAKGFRARLSPDVDQQAAGEAQLDIANALEAQMDRHLANDAPDLLGQYQTARIGFAKNNTIREALVGHDIDPQVVSKLADKNPGIGGGLKTIADLAEYFPKIATQKVPDPGTVHGFLGALGNIIAAPVRYGARSIMGATRGEVANPTVSLSSALSDYANRGPSGLLARGPMTQSLLTHDPTFTGGNQGLEPADQALADAVAARHPGSPRPAPLALPAPGQLAPTAAAVAPVQPSVALQHPASPDLSSTVTQAAQRARIQHMIDVLTARGAGVR